MNVKNRSHRIAADVDIAVGVIPEGVLLATGCVLGGWSFQLHQGRLRYVHNLYGKETYTVSSDTVIGAGPHTLEFLFTKTDEHTGTATLSCDGELLGEGDIPHFTPASYNGTGVGLSCGYELGPAIGEGYEAPFRFRGGVLHRVVVDVSDSGDV